MNYDDLNLSSYKYIMMRDSQLCVVNKATHLGPLEQLATQPLGLQSVSRRE